MINTMESEVGDMRFGRHGEFDHGCKPESVREAVCRGEDAPAAGMFLQFNSYGEIRATWRGRQL